MADRLTQLQDCLDELFTLMYASMNYVHYRHPYADIPGQPSQAPQLASQQLTVNGSTATANGDGSEQAAASKDSQAVDDPRSEHPDTFNAVLHEMAQDLVVKEQQMEHVIHSLPGLGNREEDQSKRIRELEAELRQVEEERMRKEVERQAMVDLLGEVISKVKRVP